MHNEVKPTMQRRKFLAGLGSLTAAGAAAMGTGAFTSVSASRDITIDVAGDANAFLKFTKAMEGESVTPNAQEYVTIEGDNTVALDFSQTAEGGAGVNDDATTIFDNLLDVTNQGSQEVNIGVDLSTEPDPIGIYAEDEQGTQDDNGGGFAVRHYNDPEKETLWDHTLGVGDTLENIGVYVTDPGAIDGETTYTVSIIAERVGGNRD